MKKLFIVAFSTLISYGTFAQSQDNSTVDSSTYSVTTRTVTTTTYGYDQNNSATNTNNSTYQIGDNTWDPFFRFGIKAGANLSNIRGNDLAINNGGSAFDFRDMSDRSFGFVGGVFMRFGRDFYVQPEILVSQKGGTFNVYRDGVTNSQGEVDVKFSNVDIPVLFGARIGNTFRINAGPMASFRLSNRPVGPAFAEFFGEDSEEMFEGRTAFGYQAGVGFDFGRLSLDVRYEGNFNDIMNIRYGNQQTAAQFGRKSNLWQATLGFALF